MKIRQGFVSNSSSSSFIVISDNKPNEWLPDYGIDLEYGEYEYGWQVARYSGYADKVNWCLLIGTPEQIEMTKDVVFEHTGLALDADQIEKVLEDGYIDHQSGSDEEPANAAMFDSVAKLKRFIFQCESYIHNGNDNY